MKTPCPSRLATAAALLALSCAAQAQTALERVEVTGTAIKRIDGETALPVQVITRAEIDKAGVTTAAELVARLSASANNLTDGGSVGYGGWVSIEMRTSAPPDGDNLAEVRRSVERALVAYGG